MDINFMTIGLAIAGVGLGVTGVMMAGGPIWPETAEKAKKNIWTILMGLLIIAIGGALIEGFTGGL